MACYHPVTVWYSKHVNPSGKRSLVHSAKDALNPYAPFKRKCGQCVGCRLEDSRQKAIRCMHEMQLHEHNGGNCFITLTFNEDSIAKREVPESLDHRDWQLFIKKLRKQVVPKNPYEKGTDKYKAFAREKGVRFYMCGEYGEESGRPHYHAIIFNYDFPDKEPWMTRNGFTLYRSSLLEQLWPYGYSSIAEANFETAAYVARYVMKKVNGDAKEDHYRRYRVDEETGEILETIDLKPEYNQMPNKPGLAKWWYDEFKDDVYPKDYIIVKGKEMRPPKYYDLQLEKENPFELARLKEIREWKGLKHKENNTHERLLVREQVQKLKLEKLIRPLPDDY